MELQEIIENKFREIGKKLDQIKRAYLLINVLTILAFFFLIFLLILKF